METREWIALFGATLTLGALIKAILEYTKAQKWKRAEFLAKEVKELYDDPKIQKAFKLIDWDVCELELDEKDAKGKSLSAIVTPKVFNKAMRHHSKGGNFTPTEEVIRDIMDHFFFRLSLFQNYVETDLIRYSDVKKYLIYYVRILSDQNSSRRDEKFRKAIAGYLSGYGFSDVMKLFQGLGFMIKIGEK